VRRLPFLFIITTFRRLPISTCRSMVDFLDAVADGLIQNLAGIKYTHYDLEDLQLCLHYGGGKYNILFGRDQYLLAAVALGVRGAVGSTYS
jgi:N-acetylneuraminate lyase